MIICLILAPMHNMPSLEEQNHIAEILNTADREIALLEEKLDALNEREKGPMRKLMAGETRTKLSITKQEKS